MDCSMERWNIDFGVCKSIRYHAYRRAFWDAFNNFSKILTIISGTAVLVSIVGEYKLWATAMAVVVAITSATDLVLGFSEKARKHDGLYRAFSLLAQEIAENDGPDAQTISRWQRRRLEIEMDEPLIVDWLERRCSGEEARARGCALRPSWKLNAFQITVSQFAFWPATHKDESPEIC